MASYYDPPQYAGPSFGHFNRRDTFGNVGGSYAPQGSPMGGQNVAKLGDGNPYTGGMSSDPGGETVADLYARMGFGESTYRGSNPGHSILNKMLPGLGSRVLKQIGFGNSLEPGRQSAISALIRSMSPGNQKAKVGAYGARAQEQARQSIKNTPAGYGSGFTEGMEQDAYNRAGEATRGFDAYLSGPGGEKDSLEALLSAIGAGQNTDMDEFLAMLGIDSPYNQFRQTQVGKGSTFGGLSGILGGLAGGYQWGSK